MSSLRWIAFGLLLVGLGVSSVAAWWQSYGSIGSSLPAWRRRALRFGAVGNAVSLLLYLADLGRFQLIMRGVVGYTGTGWADSGWVLLALIALGVVNGMCGAFGQRAARLLTVTNGIILAALWCFLGAGTSA